MRKLLTLVQGRSTRVAIAVCALIFVATPDLGLRLVRNADYAFDYVRGTTCLGCHADLSPRSFRKRVTARTSWSV